MATAGAPIGNTNARNKGRFRGALIKRIEELDAMNDIVQALVTNAINGDMQAIKEVADRLDGKAHTTNEQNIGISVHVHRALEDAGATIEHEQPLISDDSSD